MLILWHHTDFPFRINAKIDGKSMELIFKSEKYGHKCLRNMVSMHASVPENGGGRGL